MSDKQIVAGLASFFGINGISQLVYRLIVECVDHTPNGDCVTRSGWTDWPAGAWVDEASFAFSWLIVSLICTTVAIFVHWE